MEAAFINAPLTEDTKFPCLLPPKHRFTAISLPMFQTMIVEVEAVLNDRPLIYMSSDIDDPDLSLLHTSCMAARLLDYHMNTMLRIPRNQTMETNHKYEDKSGFKPTSWKAFNHNGCIPKGISLCFWTQFPADQGGICHLIPWWWTSSKLEFGCCD